MGRTKIKKEISAAVSTRVPHALYLQEWHCGIVFKYCSAPEGKGCWEQERQEQVQEKQKESTPAKTSNNKNNKRVAKLNMYR